MAIATLADYRRITRDRDSYDGDIYEALDAAQDFLEENTDRFFETDTRTESLKVHSDGRVYPHATPITAVTTPTNTISSTSSIALGAYGMDVAVRWPEWFQASPGDDIEWFYVGSGRPRLTVTYTGGYDEDEIPESLKRLVVDIAKVGLSETMNVPVGATSVRSGDIAYSGRSLGESLPARIWYEISKWKRREL